MRLPDGTRLQGAYGHWRGTEYELGPVQADGTVVLKHHGENAPAGFEKASSAREFPVPDVYWRKVSRSEIESPVTVSTQGTWVVQGRQDHAPARWKAVFDLQTVDVRGYVGVQLLDPGTQTLKWWAAQPGLRLEDRFVYGDIAFSELTEVREEVAPFALPDPPRQRS